ELRAPRRLSGVEADGGCVSEPEAAPIRACRCGAQPYLCFAAALAARRHRAADSSQLGADRARRRGGPSRPAREILPRGSLSHVRRVGKVRRPALFTRRTKPSHSRRRRASRRINGNASHRAGAIGTFGAIGLITARFCHFLDPNFFSTSPRLRIVGWNLAPRESEVCTRISGWSTLVT